MRLSHTLEILLIFRISRKSSDVWPQPLVKSEVGHFPLSFIVFPVVSAWVVIHVAHLWCLFVVLLEPPLRDVQSTRWR